MQRVFRHLDDAVESFTVGTFHPLFCDACAAIHDRELVRPGLDRFVKRVIEGGGTSFGAAANLAIALFLTPKLVPGMLTGGLPGALLGFAVLGFFYAIGIACAWVVKSRTGYLTCAPPTSVTASIDFTDDLSDAFEPSWRRFDFQNAAYARSFRALNAARIWEPRGDKARRAGSIRKAVRAVAFLILAVLLLLAYRDELSGFWERTLEWLRL